MIKEFQQANLFELSEGNIQVTYMSSGLDGNPLFSYRDGTMNCQFSGDEIRSVTTEIGELLTVILEQTVDVRTVTFTLVLPLVMVLPSSAGAHVQVLGLTTTTHTSIAGSVFGPQKTYSPVTLNGTAQAVSF